MLQMHMLSEV